MVIYINNIEEVKLQIKTKPCLLKPVLHSEPFSIAEITL